MLGECPIGIGSIQARNVRPFALLELVMAARKDKPGDGNVAQLNFFSAVPGRATSDLRLSGLHFRILCAIAGYDRMGRNGRSCFAGSKTLAANVGCAEGSFRNAVSDLIAIGYLRVERSDEDARRVGYAIVYQTAADAAGIGAKSKGSVSSSDDVKRGRNLSSNHDRSKGKASSIDGRNSRDMSSNDAISDEIPSIKSKLNQIVRSASSKPNIFCETENINREAHEMLEFGERLLGSGRGLEALPVVEQITDKTWAYVVRHMRAGSLTDVQVEVAMEEGRQRIAEKVANG